MSTAEETSNKATFKRFHEAANTGDVELLAKTIDEIVAPEALIRTPLPIDATGPELLKQVWAMLLGVYPDIHLTVEDVIAEGDKVVARNTVTGTHRGEFMGVAPTGKAVSYHEIFIFRFVDGRVAETWGVVDVYAQMKQIGVLPA
jgi:predicted ester cyclase